MLGFRNLQEKLENIHSFNDLILTNIISFCPNVKLFKLKATSFYLVIDHVDWLMSCYRIGPWLQNCSMAVSKEKNLSPEAMQVQPVAHNSFSKLFSVTKYC